MDSPTTPISLLSRLRDSEDHAAWREFDRRYRDLMLRYCRRRGIPHTDAEDVVQRVLANLIKALPQFTYDPQRGRFRNYLFRCVKNAHADWAARPNRHWRSLDTDAADEHAAADDRGQDAQIWEEEWVAFHYRCALETVRKTFDPRSVEIFDRNVAGASVAELAQAYDMSEQAVHKIRQRIRARLEELIAAQVRAEDEVDGQLRS